MVIMSWWCCNLASLRLFCDLQEVMSEIKYPIDWVVRPFSMRKSKSFWRWESTHLSALVDVVEMHGDVSRCLRTFLLAFVSFLSPSCKVSVGFRWFPRTTGLVISRFHLPIRWFLSIPSQFPTHLFFATIGWFLVFPKFRDINWRLLFHQTILNLLSKAAL